MTTFQDGPAKGQMLLLKRAPRFLRVAEAKGKWDALDQLEDKPTLEEKLYAYEIVEAPGWVHINRGGGGSGFYAVATYKFVEPQPTDAEMRINAAWPEWCSRYWNARQSETEQVKR